MVNAPDTLAACPCPGPRPDRAHRRQRNAGAGAGHQQRLWRSGYVPILLSISLSAGSSARLPATDRIVVDRRSRGPALPLRRLPEPNRQPGRRRYGGRHGKQHCCSPSPAAWPPSQAWSSRVGRRRPCWPSDGPWGWGCTRSPRGSWWGHDLTLGWDRAFRPLALSEFPCCTGSWRRLSVALLLLPRDAWRHALANPAGYPWRALPR